MAAKPSRKLFEADQVPLLIKLMVLADPAFSTWEAWFLSNRFLCNISGAPSVFFAWLSGWLVTSLSQKKKRFPLPLFEAELFEN